jgi:hypothetical protein
MHSFVCRDRKPSAFHSAAPHTYVYAGVRRNATDILKVGTEDSTPRITEAAIRSYLERASLRFQIPLISLRWSIFV